MLLVATDPRFAEHDPGRGHPERPVRLEAVRHGLRDAATTRNPRGASRFAARRAPSSDVHREAYLDQLEAFVQLAQAASLTSTRPRAPESWDAPLLPQPVQACDRRAGGRARTAASCAVRPPGHPRGALVGRWASAPAEQRRNRSRGRARSRREGADRRLGRTSRQRHQDMYWSDPDVMYVSLTNGHSIQEQGRPRRQGRGGKREHGQLPAAGRRRQRRVPRRARRGRRPHRGAVPTTG